MHVQCIILCLKMYREGLAICIIVPNTLDSIAKVTSCSTAIIFGIIIVYNRKCNFVLIQQLEPCS